MAYPTVDNPSIPQNKNLTGDDQLLLTMFSGEVLNVFRDKNTMLAKSRVMNVGAGKDFQFPRLGQADTAYHVRGESILDGSKYLSQIESTDVIIPVDKVLLSSVFVDNWDELVTHFETRSEYSYQLGAALARKMDKQLFAMAVDHALAADGSPFNVAANAAKTDSTIINKTGVNGTDAAAMGKLEDAMVEAAAAFASKDVPMDDVTFFIRPDQYYALQKHGALLNTDYGNAGNGSQAGGAIFRGYGFNIEWTNHLPSAPVVAETGENGDYAATKGVTALAMDRGAIGTVMRQSVQTETDYQVERQGTLLVSKIVCGHGILRPECLATIHDSAVGV